MLTSGPFRAALEVSDASRQIRTLSVIEPGDDQGS